MATIPFIDLIGDDRIQAILDDPANFNLRAVRAETLQDWIPDTGTYLSRPKCRMQNGIFRTSGLARSGIPAELRHRFWMKEDADRVVGRKFVGLLIYDSEGDDYSFEVIAGSDPVGAVRPWRHDNRRHLIILSQPVEILSGHIPFTVRAIGRGPCYLESVVFLSQCPAPSSYLPEIRRLSARLAPAAGRTPTGAPVGLAAEVHFITREAATAVVTARAVTTPQSPTVQSTTETPETLHSVTLAGFLPNRQYQIEVTATERGGERAQEALSLDTYAFAPPAQERVTIPLELLRLGAADPAGMPLTFGVPLPDGKLVTPRSGILRTDGQVLPVQTRVHARWPSGMARWALVDVECPAGLEAKAKVEAELVLDDAEVDPSEGLTWQVGPEEITVEGQQMRVEVGRQGLRLEHRGEDDAWRSVLQDAATLFNGELGNGLRMTGGPVEKLALEEAGPERAVIRFEVSIADDRGIIHLRSTIRLHVYHRMAFVRLIHRLTVVSPALAEAFDGADLSHLTPELAYLRDAVAGETGEATSLLRLRSLELRLPWHGSAVAGQRIVHEHDRAHRVEQAEITTRHEGRWPGVLTLRGTAGNLALCCKHFWQTYPKAIRHDEHGVAVELFPALSGDPLPDYDELWHKLYFWYDKDGAGYRLKVGMSFTAEMLIGCPATSGDAAAWHDWLEQPPAARPEIEYLNGSGALLPVAPKAGSPHVRYEAMTDAAVQSWIDRRDELHEYGFMSFGDTYSDYEWFWSNNEYDAPFCHTIEFLRGGDPRWTLLGAQSARHMTDIDTCNYSRGPSQIGAEYMHIPGHAGGFLPPYFRSKSSGSTSAPSHSWVEGAALHYLLTGDEAVREVASNIGLRFTRNLRYYDFYNMRECGWHITHLCGMARMTDDPRYLNAAAVIVEKVLEKQEPGGGWEHPLAEAHCHCEPPRCRGEAGFMVGVALSALRKYYALTADPRVADAIVGGVRWLLEKTYVPEVGHFRYTSCPTRGGPGPGYTIQVIEALADAYSFARDPRIAEVLERSLADIGLSAAELGRTRYGVGLNQEMRYIPAMLHVLQQLEAVRPLTFASNRNDGC